MALPKIDLSLFTKGSQRDREQVALDLLNGFSKHGFVKIVSHGILQADVVKVFEWNRAFFNLKGEDKAAIAHPGGSEPQRGWSAVGAENSSRLYRKGLLKSQITEELKDAREHFDQGPKNDLQYPNRWPDESKLPGFRRFMEDTFEAMEKVALQIMEALEVGFHLPVGAFTSKITKEHNSSEFRLLHYPAIDVEEIKRGRVSRIWPHFDLGVITLLFQDSVGGLEFENRKQPGTFNRVMCEDTADLVVNVSETLQRWTNGILPAGLHRVSLPESLEDQRSGLVPERYSVAYFCKADRESSVGPLRQFVHDGFEAKYEDISALAYHQQRLQSAY